MAGVAPQPVEAEPARPEGSQPPPPRRVPTRVRVVSKEGNGLDAKEMPDRPQTNTEARAVAKTQQPQPQAQGEGPGLIGKVVGVPIAGARLAIRETAIRTGLDSEGAALRATKREEEALDRDWADRSSKVREFNAAAEEIKSRPRTGLVPARESLRRMRNEGRMWVGNLLKGKEITGDELLAEAESYKRTHNPVNEVKKVLGAKDQEPEDAEVRCILAISRAYDQCHEQAARAFSNALANEEKRRSLAGVLKSWLGRGGGNTGVFNTAMDRVETVLKGEVNHQLSSMPQIRDEVLGNYPPDVADALDCTYQTLMGGAQPRRDVNGRDDRQLTEYDEALANMQRDFTQALDRRERARQNNLAGVDEFMSELENQPQTRRYGWLEEQAAQGGMWQNMAAKALAHLRDDPEVAPAVDKARDDYAGFLHLYFGPISGGKYKSKSAQTVNITAQEHLPKPRALAATGIHFGEFDDAMVNTSISLGGSIQGEIDEDDGAQVAGDEAILEEAIKAEFEGNGGIPDTMTKANAQLMQLLTMKDQATEARHAVRDSLIWVRGTGGLRPLVREIKKNAVGGLKRSPGADPNETIIYIGTMATAAEQFRCPTSELPSTYKDVVTDLAGDLIAEGMSHLNSDDPQVKRAAKYAAKRGGRLLGSISGEDGRKLMKKVADKVSGGIESKHEPKMALDRDLIAFFQRGARACFDDPRASGVSDAAAAIGKVFKELHQREIKPQAATKITEHYEADGEDIAGYTDLLFTLPTEGFYYAPPDKVDGRVRELPNLFNQLSEEADNGSLPQYDPRIDELGLPGLGKATPVWTRERVAVAALTDLANQYRISLRAASADAGRLATKLVGGRSAVSEKMADKSTSETEAGIITRYSEMNQHIDTELRNQLDTLKDLTPAAKQFVQWAYDLGGRLGVPLIFDWPKGELLEPTDARYGVNIIQQDPPPNQPPIEVYDAAHYIYLRRQAGRKLSEYEHRLFMQQVRDYQQLG